MAIAMPHATVAALCLQNESYAGKYNPLFLPDRKHSIGLWIQQQESLSSAFILVNTVRAVGKHLPQDNYSGE
jgi:hypothetical protein